MKKKPPKSRNPIAKNLRVNKPKVIPDKRKKAQEKLMQHLVDQTQKLGGYDK